ncbi:hypothetical protein JOE21_003065 [Desmospora profundinema]|uniref:Uncharacterized protein n=1 Tax=Desmospora profundinema TaxID=1571184 RepID=A0ABU1IQI7_9BACL|nr:hypothetical protein [Desmospora profundinema]
MINGKGKWIVLVIIFVLGMVRLIYQVLVTD